MLELRRRKLARNEGAGTGLLLLLLRGVKLVLIELLLVLLLVWRVPGPVHLLACVVGGNRAAGTALFALPVDRPTLGMGEPAVGAVTIEAELAWLRHSWMQLSGWRRVIIRLKVEVGISSLKPTI